MITKRRKKKAKRKLGVVLVVLGLAIITGIGVVAFRNQSTLTVRVAVKPSPDPSPTPLWHAEPLIPTAQPETRPGSINAAVYTGSLSSRPITTTGSATSLISADEIRWRFGVGVPYLETDLTTISDLELGWYLAWRVLEQPPLSNIEFWPMIRIKAEGYWPAIDVIQRAALANPGAVWIIGNEPDVIWQDNVTPTRYAQAYHELYTLLKEIDPTCQIAIGGITQPTPLRLQYLDLVLSSYRNQFGEDMPVEIWNIHNFILREERDSWGVDIPPGLDVAQGRLYTVEDHDDLELFKAQIIDFRRWMAERGQHDKPLVITEYGILMPADYGFDEERVQQFLLETYRFLLRTTDRDLGYPADDYHLVQRWAWYSLSDDRYPTGNFVDFATNEITAIGQTHRTFMGQLIENSEAK